MHLIHRPLKLFLSFLLKVIKLRCFSLQLLVCCFVSHVNVQAVVIKVYAELKYLAHHRDHIVLDKLLLVKLLHHHRSVFIHLLLQEEVKPLLRELLADLLYFANAVLMDKKVELFEAGIVDKWNVDIWVQKYCSDHVLLLVDLVEQCTLQRVVQVLILLEVTFLEFAHDVTVNVWGDAVFFHVLIMFIDVDGRFGLILVQVVETLGSE